MNVLDIILILVSDHSLSENALNTIKSWLRIFAKITKNCVGDLKIPQTEIVYAEINIYGGLGL